MPSQTPSRPTRRRLLTGLAALPLLSSAPSAFAFSQKSIREFGKIYDYLMDGHLRAKELDRQRISVKGADFTGEKIERNTSWQYIDFVDCEFAGLYTIHLAWLTDSTFTNCRFRGHFGLGHARDVKFINCTVEGGSTIAFFSKSTGLVFKDCKFLNSSDDSNHVGSINSKNEITFIDCKAKNFAWGGHKNLTLRRCTARGIIHLDTASPGLFSDKSKMPYSDFLLEDCDFRDGVYAINGELNEFTLRRCKVKVFALYGADVLGDALFEGIQEGYLIAAAAFKGRLTIRDCTFSGAEE
ncbi:MAG: right-handed parallel beta-helix repeat-containing protein, partial [Zoogloeaceae bacterium]|nr:right-handed parallel beta-helix repeat-containing protein [Zoogloeaceae bacterium]